VEPRSAILEATARLLREQGARAVTTRAVAEAAGVQAPTLYRLFGDKDGLIDAVAEQVMAAHVASKAGEAIDPDPLQDLRAGWRTHVGFGLANPELFALLLQRGPSSPATAAGIEHLRARVHRLALAGVLRVSEPRALDLIHAAGSGTVLALLNQPADERDAGLSDAMLDAVLAAILRDAPASEPAGPLHLAVGFAAVIGELPSLSDAERTLLREWVGRAIAAYG
jgi:AcrR family transcriptional regulator